MTTYEFFNSCLNAARTKYDSLLKTPRARAGGLENDVKEIKNQIAIARDYEEISVEQASELLREFNKIKFENLAADRAARKRSEQYDGRFKFS